MTSFRRTAAACLIALAALCPAPLRAHAGLRFSSPLDGATLGDTPTEIVLSFFEAPEPALSTIEVLDTNGTAYHGDRPATVAGDPLSLRMPVRRLGRGVYTVRWRVVSAVDGHASAGAFVFGVLTAPTANATAVAGGARTSYVEGASRAILAGGFVLLLGAAAAIAGQFGAVSAVRLSLSGLALAVLGLICLASIQWRAANVSLPLLLDTAVGRGLWQRAAALAVAAAGVAMAIRASRTGAAAGVRAAATVIALGTIAAVAVHSATGHAAAVPARAAVSIGFQIVHILFAGLWLGGLTAVVFAMSRASARLEPGAIGRFSTVAAIGLAVVLISGLVRLFDEIAAPEELIATTYGRVLSAKILIFAAIGALGAWNRFRNVPAAAERAEALRRAATLEIALAAAALVAAGFLAALPPPASARTIPGIVATGEDFGTTVRVRFAAASDQPGPNRFTVAVRDYDTRAAIRDARVTLQFDPPDDPRVAATTLALVHDRDGIYTGSGANLAFDGRWRVTVRIERANGSASVPLMIETRAAAPFVSILRPPGEPPTYTVGVKRANIRVSAVPARAGTNRLYVTCMDGIMEALPMQDVIVTIGSGANARQITVRRESANAFAGDVAFTEGSTTIAVVGRTTDGTRIRVMFTLQIF